MMRKIAFPILLVLGALVAACGGAPAGSPATVDQARAVEIATDAFEAFNADDYAGWSRDWSTTMKSAIPEADFAAWRTSAFEQLGRYVSLGMPTRSSRKSGTYRWSFPVTFERGTASIGFAFVEGRGEVEGVFVE